jgi:hypothetical protein
LLGHQHAFVEHGSAREAADEEVFVSGTVTISDGLFCDFPNHVETSFEGGCVGQIRAAPDKELSHDRFTIPGGFPQAGIIGGDSSPTQDCLAVVRDCLLESFLTALAVGRVLRQEDHGHPIFFWGRQIHSGFGGNLLEKLVRVLNQYSSAVARVRFTSTRTPMVEPYKDFEPLFDDFVCLMPLDVDNKSHPAGIVFMGRVVESLLDWCCGLIPVIARFAMHQSCRN